MSLVVEVLKFCKIRNIDIVNTQEDLDMGFPWVFIYKKNN